MNTFIIKMTAPKNTDEYIASFPETERRLLEQMRAIIKAAAPEAGEVISYSMPAFKLNGMLVWYAAYTKHIGFYPKPLAIEVFKKELSSYKCSKGAIQFPFDQPLPASLITEIVKFRVMENLKKGKTSKR